MKSAKQVQSPTLESSIALASTAHEGQVDRRNRPYILHPLEVMIALTDPTEEEQMVAVLHDVLEDTYVTVDDLRDTDAKKAEKTFSKINRSLIEFERGNGRN